MNTSSICRSYEIVQNIKGKNNKIGLPYGYAMLVRPNKAETAIHCHCSVTWLCACVRYWPDRELVFVCHFAFIIATFSCCVYNFCFHGVWRHFRAILTRFRFSLFLHSHVEGALKAWATCGSCCKQKNGMCSLYGIIHICTAVVDKSEE